jgi:hypothetical protein
MGIFKRHEQPAVQPAGAAPASEGSRQDKSTTLMPPFVSAPRDSAAPGVVPPPAALMFEMNPPDSARVDVDAASLVAEQVRKTPGSQQAVEKRVRVALQRARTASRATASRRVAVAAMPSATAAWQQGRQTFDPVRCAQAGLLNLAWSWQQAGAPIRAIHAYMQVLCRYPDTPGAAAAVADLVELSEILTEEGKYHLALSIYDELERVL